MRSVVIALVGLSLVGCAATREAGKPFPSAERGKLVLDRTSTAEAEKLLGPPATKSTGTEGRETWTYEYTRVSALRAVPFGRRVTVKQTPYEQLTLTFRNGRLTECAYVAERYRTEDSVIVPDGSSRETCGRPAR